LSKRKSTFESPLGKKAGSTTPKSVKAQSPSGFSGVKSQLSSPDMGIGKSKKSVCSNAAGTLSTPKIKIKMKSQRKLFTNKVDCRQTIIEKETTAVAEPLYDERDQEAITFCLMDAEKVQSLGMDRLSTAEAFGHVSECIGHIVSNFNQNKEIYDQVSKYLDYSQSPVMSTFDVG
jgi:hypothetical protein